jgi:hypothetical protein
MDQRKRKKQPGKQNKNKKNYPPRQRKWTEKAEVLQKTKYKRMDKKGSKTNLKCPSSPELDCRLCWD